jgi:hypothetical protein
MSRGYFGEAWAWLSYCYSLLSNGEAWLSGMSHGLVQILV